METSDEGGEDVRILAVEVVAWSVEVRRHRRDPMHPVLPPVCLNLLDACDLRNRVRIVRRFEGPREQARLRDWLGRKLWINTRGAQKW